MATTLAHFYVNSQNMGDRGSAVGIQTIFHQADPSVRFRTFNLDTDCIWSKTRGRLESQCDGLVIGGGGLLYNHPTHASGWYFHCNWRNYRQLCMPRCFYGIGINAEHAGEPRWTLKRSTMRSIGRFAQRTGHVGVRDMRSLVLMRRLGVEHAQLVPCPSMFIPGDGQPLADPQRTVAINLTLRAASADVCKALMDVLIQCCRSHQLDPVFVVHYAYEDQPLVEMARSRKIPVFQADAPQELMRFYRSCRLLVGMRGHSLLYASGAGIPMLALAYNAKCDAHMELMQLERWLIPYRQLSQPREVANRLEQLLAEQQPVRQQVIERREQFRLWNLSFAQQFLHAIKAHQQACEPAIPRWPAV